MAYTTIDKPSDYFNTVLYTGNNGILEEDVPSGYTALSTKGLNL